MILCSSIFSINNISINYSIIYCSYKIHKYYLILTIVSWRVDTKVAECCNYKIKLCEF